MVEALIMLAALLAAVSALGVVFSRDVMRGALSLIVTLLALAGIYAGLGAYFLAAVQVIVYAGAIMVLFMFTIMVLKSRREPSGSGVPVQLQRVGALLVGGILLAGLIGSRLPGLDASPLNLHEKAPGMSAFARLLFREYVLPFELVGLLLFATLVAVMVLARRDEC